MKSFSRNENPNGARHRNTAAGRAISIKRERDRERRQQLIRQPARPGQQAEQHEHHDLREPGHGIEEDDNRIMRAQRAVADDQAGEIDREKTGGMDRLAQAEHHDRRRRDKGRLQSLRQGHAG